MKKFFLLLFITGGIILSLMGLVANAAPTSTILLIPKIPGLASTGNPCLTVGDSSTLGLVATSTCGSGGTFARAVTKVVCASNAIDTTNCDYKATGTADDVTIQSAINAVSSSAAGIGLVQLSEGTFNVSSTVINNKNDIWIRGTGRGATLINLSSGNTTYGFHLGNAQASGNNTIVHISDMTITANNTSTVPLWLDGMGQGSDVANIKTNSGLYGVIFEDADRVTAENVEANNAFTAQIVLRQGNVNTFGKFSLINVRATIGYASSSGWLFDTDSDQPSPNSMGAITLLNSFAFGSTLASTTCYNFSNAVTGLSVIGTEAENCTTQVNISAEVDGSWIDSDFLNTPTSSQNIFYINAFSNLTFISNNFQQAINAFNGVSGFPKLTFLGQNRNAGNITNVFTGSFNIKLGTDTGFAGDNKLDVGLAANRVANVRAVNLIASSTNTANLTVTGVTSSLGLLGSGGLLSPFLGSNCSGGQAANGLSATGTVTGCFTPSGGTSTNVFGTNGINVVQVGTNATATNSGMSATFVVATSTAISQYQDLQSAINALPSGGGTIFVRAGTYTLSTTTLIKQGGTTIIGEGKSTIFQAAGDAVSPLIKTNAIGYQNVIIENLYLKNTTTTAQGTGLDLSDTPNAYVQRVRFDNFTTGLNLVDTTNTTFYSTFRDLQFIDNATCINIGGNPANQNFFDAIRCRPYIWSLSTTTGLNIVSARGLTFNDLDVEPATSTGVTGITISSSSRDIIFTNPWIENNATGTTIDSTSLRIGFVGASFSNTTANLVDSGTNDYVIAANNSSTLLNLLPQKLGIGITSTPATALSVGAPSSQNTIRVNGATGANLAPVLSLFRTGNNEWSIAGGGLSQNDFNISLNPSGAYSDASIASTSDFTIFGTSGNVAVKNSLNVTGTITQSGSAVAISAGLGVNGDCVKWSGANTISDQGAACGSGGGAATATIAVAGVTFSSPFTFATTTGVTISSSSGAITFGLDFSMNPTWTGQHIFSATTTVHNGATANMTSSTKPLLAIIPQAWVGGNASGDLLGINVTNTFNGNLVNIMSSSTGRFSIASSGVVTINNITSAFVLSTNGVLSAYVPPSNCVAGNALIGLTAVGGYNCSAFGSGNGTLTTSTANTAGQIAIGDGGTAIRFSSSFTATTSTGVLAAPTGTYSGTLSVATTTISAAKLYVNGDVAINSSTDNGFLSVTNASNTVVLQISTTTGATSSAVTLNVLGNASTSPKAPVSVFQIFGDGHINATGTTPVLSSCGGSPTISGSDAMGQVVVGTAATGCTITFQVPYESAPHCIIENETLSITSAFTYTETSSSIVAAQGVGLSGDKLNYWCWNNM